MSVAVLLAGAVCSLDLTLNAGRNNSSILLLVLFGAWVLSPFTALLLANVISKRWLVLTRATLYCLTLFLTLGSLLGYSGVLRLSGTKPAFVFLVVPFISWLLIIIVIPIAVSLSRKLSRTSDSV